MEPPLPQRIWSPWREAETPCELSSSFTLARAARCELFVTSSGPLEAEVDGEGLALPAPRFPLWRAGRRAALRLEAGEHRLVLRAEPGPHAQPFALACLDWEEGGAPRRAATDATWRVRRLDADGTPDAAEPPLVIGGVWCEPWGMPCDAPLDFCRLLPGWQRVATDTLGRAGAAAGAVRCDDGLAAAGGRARVEGDRVRLVVAPPHARETPVLPEGLPEPAWYQVRDIQSRWTNRWLEPFDARAPRVTFDLGRETFARLRRRVESGGPAIVAVRSGESLGELERYAARSADVVRLEDGESFATSPTGLRYAAVMALAHAGPELVLAPLEVDHISHPVRARGSFACSDPDLDAIWELGARTVHLCMQSELWDGIKRDQIPWMGDLSVEALAAFHARGDRRVVRRTYTLLGELGPGMRPDLREQRYPGLFRAMVTEEPDLHGIASYTLWWLVGLADYLDYTGDATLIDELAARIVATVEHVAGAVEADGRWRRRAGWDFVDWAPLADDERALFCQLLAAPALGCAVRLLAGRDDGAAELARKLGARVRGATQRLLEERGPAAFASSHHVAAMAVRSGCVERGGGGRGVGHGRPAPPP
ncbi:MAG: hypothetical protein AAF682_27090, partial [Planctomycetota bacterium]